MLARPAALALALLLSSMPLAAQEQRPKFGPDALPLLEATDYLRQAPAPDYWRLAAFYLPQETSSACSVASVAMVVNALRGLPAGSEDPLVTQAAMLESVGDPSWIAKTVEQGEGVTFADLVAETKAALVAYDLEEVAVDAFRPQDEGPASLEGLRRLLVENESSAADQLLVYFNQGVLTGDWDGPHISPIGAYDAERDRVLIMDVDRGWYVPYWSPVSKLLEAMTKPTGAEHGPLAGETGGLVRVSAPR
jgi:hypothetical protein